MTPNEWLELVTKHASNADSVSPEELVALRSNYAVWKAALDMLGSENRNRLIHETQTALNNKILPKEEFRQICDGEVKPESLTEEQWNHIAIARGEHQRWTNKLRTALATMKFYQRFDEEFEAENNTQPPELVEFFWQQRAKNLEQAIVNHRTAHVVANKQPNGLDFVLWQEIGQEEFHASRHAGIQQNGYISFKEV